MKKMLGLLLALAMMVAMCGGALADGTMYEGDIQFSGHTFGETFATALTSTPPRTIDFQKYPWFSRMHADPAAMYALQGFSESSVPYVFDVRIDGQSVAGFQADPTLYFMYPSADAARDFDLKSATLYGATYDFFEGDAASTYQSLKEKLTSVYGEPYAADGSMDAVWGPMPAGRDDVDQAMVDSWVQEGVERNSPISYTAWKSATNNGLIALVNYSENGWVRTRLHYFDLNADETILQMYAPEAGAAAGSDSLEGL